MKIKAFLFGKSAFLGFLFPALAVSGVVQGCGGGGGGGNDGFGDFAGVWNGSASLVEDSCIQLQSAIFFNHLVKQDRGVVTLDNGATTFDGAAEADSFTVSASRPFPGGTFGGVGNCTEEITWRYEAVRRNEAQFVVRQSNVSCSESGRTSTCSTTFSGSAFRNGGGPVIFGAGGTGAENGSVSDAAL